MSELKDEIVEDVAEVIVEDTEVEAEAVETVEAPLTEARTVSAIQASMAGMSKDGLDAIFEAAKKAEAKAKVEDDEEEEDDEGDEDEGDVEEGKAKKESKKVKGEQVDGEKDLETKAAKKKKVKTTDGSEIEVTAEKKFKEDVDALVKDEDTLSEGFKAKAEVIFEAALQSKIISETAKLEERYASDLSGEVEAIKEDLVDKVDGYLTYVVENWMKDNEVAIEHSLKSEITESFIDSLGQLFSEHHINVPADKGDILDALSEEAKDAKAQLNDATANAMDLAEKVKAFERKDIVTEACKGLAATEEAKLRELTEAVEADDNESFAAKVATIKESYLNKDTTVEATPEVDAITEDTDTQEPKVIDANMQQYLSAIERTQSIS
jgi:hypothetical protein